MPPNLPLRLSADGAHFASAGQPKKGPPVVGTGAAQSNPNPTLTLPYQVQSCLGKCAAHLMRRHALSSRHTTGILKGPFKFL